MRLAVPAVLRLDLCYLAHPGPLGEPPYHCDLVRMRAVRCPVSGSSKRF